MSYIKENYIQNNLMKQPKRQTRDSNFELLRIFAMFSIILYHLLLYFIDPLSDNETIFKALQLPLHVGVLLFVLISGYYGIRPTIKGALMLLLPLVAYYMPLELGQAITERSPEKILNSLFFFSYSPYWYVRTYFYLYLFSPVLNSFLRHKSTAEINYLTFILLIVCIWLGLNKGDTSLEGGKNLLYFAVLYFVGNRIHIYKKVFQYSKHLITTIYILLNIGIVLAYCIPSSMLQAIIIKTCYMYCSPILLLNAIIIFLLFSYLSIQNCKINSFARSTYAMYIIHNQPSILAFVISPIVSYIWSISGGGKIFILLSLIFLTILIMIACYAIDNMCKPLLYKISTFISNKLEKDYIGE